ncbi:DDE-type integrase/transposase/recombinase [Streptomyces umbrinus]|uniref:DDE-type integrase/transposase/recombinase n=1 Tax=Streptomyces umbrinus TaxID=67370 RepID=UPI0033E87DB2
MNVLKPATAVIHPDRGGLAAFIDIASRRVVGRSTTDHLRTEPVADALPLACRRRRPTHQVIFRSDRGGCRFNSQQFTLLAAEFGVHPSVGHIGQCRHGLH